VEREKVLFNHYKFAEIIGRVYSSGVYVDMQISVHWEKQRLFLLGESHFLILAWKQLRVHLEERICVPKIIMGLKAWHFSEHNSTQMKEKNILIAHVATIPENSICMVSAGEFDCRIGEGVEKAVQSKKYPSLESAIFSTVQGYVDGLVQIAKTKNIQFAVHPLIPLPHPKHRQNKKTAPRNIMEQQKRIIEFNSCLQGYIQDLASKDIFFLDFIGRICDEGGWRMPIFSLEDVHLNERYIPILQEAVASWTLK